jgi:hypothetical protein
MNPTFEKLSLFVKEEVVLENPNTYAWLPQFDSKKSLVNRFPTPKHFNRVDVEDNSFASWLRYFPLKDADAQVFLYNGELKAKQNVHEAVLDIDVGSKDLQQCADAVMRLRAEYLWANSSKRFNCFPFY